MSIKLDSTTVLIGAAVVGGVVWWNYNKRAIEKGAQEALNLVNPLSPDNLAYQAVNEAGELVTGDEDFNWGSWLYDNRNNPLAFPLTRTFDLIRWIRGD